jgi:hypothetical protein
MTTMTWLQCGGFFLAWGWMGWRLRKAAPHGSWLSSSALAGTMASWGVTVYSLLAAASLYANN